MASISDIDETRRQFLIYLLSTGALTGLAGCASSSESAFALPKEMPPGRSIFQLSGDVRVNGIAASLATIIKAGDVIETFERSYVIFVVGKDSFILRSHSKMHLPVPASASTLPVAFHLARGKALTVLASRKTQLTTPTAIIGIRGTGVYIESEDDLSYVCTCYGIADLATSDNAAVKETILSEHHDQPRYILASGQGGSRIQPAPFKNHDDEELLLIETLVGRTTPYVVPQGLTRTRSRYF